MEEAISIAQDWKGSFHLFPLFMVEDGGYFFVGTQEKCQTAPIYCKDIPEEVVEREPNYPSLTSMVQELVEELRSRS
ncbi:hypothetical protein [Nostoc sp.]|uniref:hypothetical protein n=1 Tax=Nostoc sp. TaxID=1180 RepID=UPI002FF38158